MEEMDLACRYYSLHSLLLRVFIETLYLDQQKLTPGLGNLKLRRAINEV